jgi:hypothetical protein
MSLIADIWRTLTTGDGVVAKNYADAVVKLSDRSRDRNVEATEKLLEELTRMPQGRNGRDW